MDDAKRKKRKGIIRFVVIAGLLCAIACLIGYALPIYQNAKNLGVSIGDKTGAVVGNVIGSFDGITTGLSKGAADGKEEGLSAKDTKSEIRNRFSEIGNLEVLEAGVKLKNVNTLGDDYAALFLLKGVAVYSVNLKDIEINDIDADTLEILLPEITVEVYIDERDTEKLAEYQKRSWTGSAEDGFVEYMNTRSATDQSVRETMEDDAALTEAAEDAAIKQVALIAKAATGNKKEVIVGFKEGQADE